MSPATVVSIHVGLPQELGDPHATSPSEKLWFSGFIKSPVVGPVAVSTTNLAGDGQADLENHGGADKAVCVYSADHYAFWRERLDVQSFPYGAFGENFTVHRLAEEDVCVGDVWAIGTALFQISQPRQPCWKLARRWQIKDLAAQVVNNGRTGWYLRVLQPGVVEVGQEMVLIDRPLQEWTLHRANQIMHHRKRDLAAAYELACVEHLSMSWKAALYVRARSGEA